jgi:hypothetical protein
MGGVFLAVGFFKRSFEGAHLVGFSCCLLVFFTPVRSKVPSYME